MQLDWYGKDDKQGLIRFSGHCRPFLMVCHFCEKLECPCIDATIQFVEGEEDGKPATNAIRFSIKINVQTWEHEIVSDDNRPITSLVTEFMDQAPAHLRDDLLTGYLYTKRLKKAFKGFTLAPEEIRGGRLISFMEFMYQAEANPMTDDWYGFTTTHEDEEILIDDCYCLNPQCTCKDITLQFTKICEKEGVNALETLFNTTLNLKSNRISPPQSISGCSRSYANAVLATWQAEMDDVVLDTIMYRRKTMRNRANRLFKDLRRTKPMRTDLSGPQKNPLPIMEIESTPDNNSQQRVSRNDPCPCGSGKKYKKCCLPLAGLAANNK